MRIAFRQGIITHEDYLKGTPGFLIANGDAVSLFVVDQHTLITISHFNENYLFVETQSIENAWIGPFITGTDYWLYWDIDLITGIRTFGHTTVEPVYGITPPNNPVIDQHWFDKTENVMKVFNGTSFLIKLRVFATKYTSAVDFDNMANPVLAAFTGTQVQSNNSANAGFLIYDVANNPIKQENNTFYTTESEFITQIPNGSRVKLERMLTVAIAQQPIVAYRMVKFIEFNQVIPSEILNLNNEAFGIVEEDTITGQIANVIMEGVIENPAWNWSAVNKFVYANAVGLIEETPMISNQIPVGITIGFDKILLRTSLILETGVTNVLSDIDASVETKGISKLSVNAISPTNPIVVGDNDPRMTDARVPLSHNHTINQVSLLQTTLDNKVDIVGDTMTGFLTLHADPIDSLHAATKQYVDLIGANVWGLMTGTLSNQLDLQAELDAKVNIDGDTMTDFLTLHADPIDSLHAATKQYVDDNTGATSFKIEDLDGDTVIQTEQSSGNDDDFITIQAPGNIELNTTAPGSSIVFRPQGIIQIANNKPVRFQEDIANGIEFIGLTSPAAVTIPITYTLPQAPPTDDYILKTSSTGVMSWIPQPKIPYDVVIYIIGQVINSTEIFVFDVIRDMIVNSGLPLPLATAKIASTLLTTLLIKKNGSQIGTITFHPGNTDGVISLPVTTFNYSDVFSIEADNFTDTTLLDVKINIPGELL